MPAINTCRHLDRLCPCQDGDVCHYEGANPWPRPTIYIYRWNRCNRKGQRCRVTARGKMNSCRVEFADGFVMITSRNAIRRAPDEPTGD